MTHKMTVVLTVEQKICGNVSIKGMRVFVSLKMCVETKQRERMKNVILQKDVMRSANSLRAIIARLLIKSLNVQQNAGMEFEFQNMKVVMMGITKTRMGVKEIVQSWKQNTPVFLKLIIMELYHLNCKTKKRTHIAFLKTKNCQE